MENSPREPLYIGPQNYSRWQPEKVSFDLPVNRPVDRPTVIFLTVEPPVDCTVDRSQRHIGCRLTARSTGTTRELGSCSRSTAWLTGLLGWPCARPREHRSTSLVDRPLVRSTIWSTASKLCLGFLGIESLSF